MTGDIDRLHRKPMTIGGREREPVALHLEEHTGEHRRRFVGARRHHRLGDRVLQCDRVNFDGGLGITRRQWWEFHRVDTVHVGAMDTTGELQHLGGGRRR